MSDVVAFTIRDGAKAYGFTRTWLYEQASKGLIQFRKSGRRTIVLRTDLDRLLASLPPAPIRQKAAA